jgi:hypothetical protein
VEFHEAVRPLHSLLFGPYLVERVADQFLRLGERTVGDTQVPATEDDPGAGGAGVQPRGVQERTGLGGVLAELHDRVHEFGRRRGRGLSGLQDDQVPHDAILSGQIRR